VSADGLSQPLWTQVIVPCINVINVCTNLIFVIYWSVRSNDGEPISCLGDFFNFKLGSISRSQHNVLHANSHF
jgi:hypothetical protein